MRALAVGVLVLGIASVAGAEAQRSEQQAAPSVETPSRGSKAAAQTDEAHQLTACFGGAPRKVTMIVVISYDGTKRRTRIKQSTRATKQMEACVVSVFDRMVFRLPPRPITVELPVEYTPPSAGL
ncbi:MAG: hypothetical protein JWO36_3758 [Myxococcales bacterium]|nr:hypothetical protein [Myxococcales bacterium]